jgi:hypothetical protein
MAGISCGRTLTYSNRCEANPNETTPAALSFIMFRVHLNYLYSPCLAKAKTLNIPLHIARNFQMPHPCQESSARRFATNGLFSVVADDGSARSKRERRQTMFLFPRIHVARYRISSSRHHSYTSSTSSRARCLPPLLSKSPGPAAAACRAKEMPVPRRQPQQWLRR